MPNKKYFIAIVIPEPILSEIENIKHNLFLEHNLKGALRSPAHITLHRPFEWKEEKETQLIETLKQFGFEKSIKINLLNFNFFEPRVIFIDVVKNETLNEIHKELTKFAQRKLKLLNEVNDLRGFHPHVTIAFRDLKKIKFLELKPKFESRFFSKEFLFTQFALLKLEKTWEILQLFE